jgi:uncharacterized protein YlxP (DUF503 family)
MIVGVCRLTLRLPGKGSLKEKRAVVRSLTARLRSKFNVAVAEVDNNDLWQTATLGVTCVSNEALHARQMLEEVVAFVERTRLDAELVDHDIEVERAF